MQTKQVIVMRKLKIRKGKMVAQGSHASMAFLSKDYGRPLTDEEQHWLDHDFTKVCCVVETEEELLNIFNKAKEKGLTAHLITDSGKTEFHGVPTNTCIAIGPHESSRIDEITRHLKLL